ncbi:MAG: YqgE/AlgH family protein [Bryobacteraceae bacterium]
MSRRLLALLLLIPFAALSQLSGERTENLRAGRFLVADAKLRDPNFVETVVLLLRYDEEGGMGVVMNRPSRIPVSRALAGMNEAKKRTEPAYDGGPVERAGLRAVLRTKTDPGEATVVVRGVYMVTSDKTLSNALKAGAQPGDLRVFLGYSGWSAGQLEAETEAGAWHILKTDADMIFDPEPETLWQRLSSDATRSIARMFNRPGRLQSVSDRHW